MSKADPVFNPEEPYGDIYGSEPGTSSPRFVQRGHYFAADRSFMSSDGSAPMTTEAPKNVERQVAQPPSVEQAEKILATLDDARRGELMAMSRNQLVELVEQLGGPVVQGEKSQLIMAAWMVSVTDAR